MAFLRMRIAELEGAINESIVYEKKDSDKIQIGSEITILFAGKEEKYHIVAPGEANILKNKLSYQSPLGKELMGKKVGEKFKFNKAEIKILDIK